MKIAILDQPFNAWAAIQQYEDKLFQQQGKCGAIVPFVGKMRDYNEGDTVQKMYLEHYPAMTQRYLEKISQEAMEKWPILDTLIMHRVGEILPNDTIVVVATWAGHRGEAFESCRYLIEELKHRAPFWKKETLVKGSRWVEQNTPSI